MKQSLCCVFSVGATLRHSIFPWIEAPEASSSISSSKQAPVHRASVPWHTYIGYLSGSFIMAQWPQNELGVYRYTGNVLTNPVCLD